MGYSVGMLSASSTLALCLLVGCTAMPALAQGMEPVQVPEKTMAARLQSFDTPALSNPPSKNRCSNAMAVVHIVIDTDGKVTSAEYASGFAEFKDPALDAVRKWSYKPYLVNSQPIVVGTTVSIFYLGDGEAMPMYTPDGNGGVKGGSMIPLPSGCSPGPRIDRR
jgi:TonB family protein